jgi:hypothetical protein
MGGSGECGYVIFPRTDFGRLACSVGLVLLLLAAPSISTAGEGNPADRWAGKAGRPLLVTQTPVITRCDTPVLEAMAATLPGELRGQVAVVLHTGDLWAKGMSPEAVRAWAERMAATADRLNLPFFVMIGTAPFVPGLDEQALIETLYKRHPNMLGTAASEVWKDHTYADLHWALPLAARHGGRHLLGAHQFFDTTDKALRQTDCLELLRRHGDRLVLVPKAANFNFHYTESVALGWWWAGFVGAWGIYYDHWNWESWGLGLPGERNRIGHATIAAVPEMLWPMHMLQAHAAGATVFYIENQLFESHAWTPMMHGAVVPTLRWMREFPAPGVEEVRRSTRLAFSAHAGTAYDLPWDHSELPAGWPEVWRWRRVDLFAGLYEAENEPLVNANRRSLLRTSGRFGAIPHLPAATPPEVIPDSVSVVDATDWDRLATPEARRAWAEARVPAETEGNAMALRWRNGWLIYHPWLNSGDASTAIVPVGQGRRLSVTVPAHAAVLVLPVEGGLRIAMNNFRIDKAPLQEVAATTPGAEGAHHYLKTHYLDAETKSQRRLTIVETPKGAPVPREIVVASGNAVTSVTSKPDGWHCRVDHAGAAELRLLW